MAKKPLVLIGILGARLDAGYRKKRWEKWRPTISLFQQEGLEVHRFELLHEPPHAELAAHIRDDILSISPQTDVRLNALNITDPWNFEDVFANLYDFSKRCEFNPDEEEYWLHITTGTHVEQICCFLLTEARHFPAKLIQTSPKHNTRHPSGSHQVIDLDLSRYDQLASRFEREEREAVTLLKDGINTLNPQFNHLIDQIERVSVLSKAPILMIGPTGAGKSALAARIYELKRRRRQLHGDFVEVNCATLRGDAAMAALFGHTRGAFTGAQHARMGLLKAANGGLLFLDEIGELGTDEQAMLLRALETGKFLPLGSDKETESHFQLIAGTNQDLYARVQTGQFRQDLLARIDLWKFDIPGLRDRPEDIGPNLDYELERYVRNHGRRARFNTEARQDFLDFARSPSSSWTRNFRDLNGAIERLATLSSGGRITRELVKDEINRLRQVWSPTASHHDSFLRELLGAEQLEEIDRFERAQLADVIQTCQRHSNLSSAGRELFQASRKRRKTVNDADRLRKYLSRYNLSWENIQVRS